MDKFGLIKVCAYVPPVKISQPDYNGSQIIEAVRKGAERDVDCMVFPELSITGYTCADLFNQEILIKSAEDTIEKIARNTRDEDIIFAVGAPVEAFGNLYNCAILLYKGEVKGVVPKSFLPNYGEFYEKRWFKSGLGIKELNIDYAGRKVAFGTDLLFDYKGAKIGVEICEDLWVPNPPSGDMAMAGAEIILNLSASDDLTGKYDYIKSLVSHQSARCRAAYIYSSAGWGESSTDLVFSGKALIGYDGLIFDDNKRFLTGGLHTTRTIDLQKIQSDRRKFNTFNEDALEIEHYRIIEVAKSNDRQKLDNAYTFDESYPIDPLPFVPSDPTKLNERCSEIVNIQSYGLMKRLDAINCKKAVIGISGGLDSTLALLVTVKAFDALKLPRKGIIGVTMPGLATTSRTKNNAVKLMETLGVTIQEIAINEAVNLHFKDIGQNPESFDVTFENSQARERTQILMDLANKENGIVIGTGDMSELALGWCTYNGDQMSMYGVNASVPKTLVRHLVAWMATLFESKTSDILKDICDTPISPELIPASGDEIIQKTENLVGPYILHDFFLYNFLRNSFTPLKIFFMASKAFQGEYSQEVILKWLKIFFRRFFSQQFKRSCMPDGPKVGSVNLSPRGDWRMPSDASCKLWLDELETINLG